MRDIHVTAETLPSAYHSALYNLLTWGDWIPCSDWDTKALEISLTMTVTNPLKEPMISKFFIGGPRELQQYAMEMLDGILDFEVEKGKWAYTYHQRYSDQIPFILQELRRNPDSRRAVMTIRDKDADMGSDDPACLQHIQYFIRQGKLDCMTLFRSNDACKATFMNAFALIMLQKRIAEELGVEVGIYIHRANSFHCYEKDHDRLQAFMGRLHKPRPQLTYYYEGDWREEMEEYVPEILEEVEELKKR
jgi:thymidylate synthase